MTVLIEFYGGPGSGKSTWAAHLFSELKVLGLKCELVQEFAKDLTFEKRDNALQLQPYVLGKQLMRLKRVGKDVDIIVTDSSPYLSTIYGPKDLEDAFYRICTHYLDDYKLLRIFVNRTKDYKKYGRTQTEDEAKLLDKVILETFNFNMFVNSNPNSIMVNRIIERIAEL